MDYIFTVTIIFIFGKATSRVADNDGRNEGLRCFEQMIHEGDISNLLIDVTSPERINQFCRGHSGLQRCTRANEHLMTVQENTEYLRKTSGVRNFYVNVCPPGTDLTAAYKGNAPCFKYIRNEILSCGSDLPDLDSYNMKKSLRTRCCALETHRECLKAAASEHCGTEASTVMEKITLRYFDSKMKECNTTSFSCDGYRPTTNEDWTSASEWNGHSSEGNDHSSEWHFPSTKDLEQEAEKDLKSTTVSDWRRSSVHDERKKHKHSDGVSVTVNIAVTLFSCFLGILLLKL